MLRHSAPVVLKALSSATSGVPCRFGHHTYKPVRPKEDYFVFWKVFLSCAFYGKISINRSALKEL